MSDRSRRSFLQWSGTCVVGCLGVLAQGTDAGALPRIDVESVMVQGQERRYPLPTVDGASIEREGQVIVVRDAGQVFALSLACPHEHAAVKWVDNARRFQCSKHNSRYLPSGQYISGRATRSLDRFPVRRDGATLVVDVSKVWQADASPHEWEAARVPAT